MVHWKVPSIATSFRRRQSLALLVAVGIPLFTALVLGLAGSRRSILRHRRGQMEVVADLKTAQVERWIEQGREAARVVANLHEVLSHLAEVLQGADAGAQSEARQDIYTEFSTMTRTFSHVYAISVLDASSGRVVLSSQRSREGQEWGQQEVFREGRRDLYVSPVVYSEERETSVLMVSAPVVGPDDDRLAVVAVEMNLDDLAPQMAERTGLGTGGQAYLVEADGFYVTSPPNNPGAPLHRLAQSEGVQRVLAGESGNGIYRDPEGVPVLGVYRWLPEVRMGLLVEMPEAEIAGQIARVWLIALAVSSVFLVVAIGGIRFVSDWLTTPLERVAATARALQAGDLTRRVSAEGPDEIGQLARAFNDMAASLQRSQEHLEDLVHQRTVELEQAEARLENIVRAAADAIIAIDENRQVVIFNQAAEKLLGWSAAEAIGRDVDTFIPERYHTRHDAHIASFLHPQQPQDTLRLHHEIYARRADGEEFPAEASVSRVRVGDRWIATVILHDISARKAAEEALRESEERYRRLVEMAPDAIGIHSGDKLLFANAAAARLFAAADPDELIGRPVLDLMAPQSRQAAQERIRRLLAGEHVAFPVVDRFRRLDGTLFFGEFTASPFVYAGRPAIQIIVRDITERRQAELELAALYELAQGILSAAPLDELLMPLYERCRQIVPLDIFYLALYDAETQMVETPLFIERGVDLGPVRSPLAEASFAGHIIRTGRLLLIGDRAEDMDALPVEPSVVGTPSEHLCYLGIPLQHRDRVIGVLSVQSFTPHAYTDQHIAILERLGQQIAVALVNAQRLQQIRDQARQMQQILDSSPAGIVLLDGERRIVVTNPRARTWLPLLTDAGAGEVLTHLGRQPVALLLDHPDGQEAGREVVVETPEHRVYAVSARPLAQDHASAGWVLVLRDVTEAREQEQHLQAQERLATVGQLAAGIAHDFNNIMAVITLYTQMLRDNPDLPKRGQYLATIHRQARYAAKLIEQILDFSRRAVMERNRFDLRPFLKETVQMWERTLPENIRFHLSVPPEPVVVHADATRLQQMLMNLAVNSRDAMPTGGDVTMDLTVVHLATDDAPPLATLTPGSWARLTFADTGCGMTPEVLQRVFNPFFTTKPPGQGTGLGLAQVYGIVKQHGGEITVASEEHQGTTFTIYLPVLEAPVEVNPASPPMATTSEGAGTILVVEDNPHTREALQDALELLGYRVLSAADGEEALDVYADHPRQIDLILSDMVMPRMGGRDLYYTLKRRYTGVQMVILSGYPLGDEGKALLEDGIVDWIRKPVAIETLEERLGRIFDADRAAQSLTEAAG